LASFSRERFALSTRLFSHFAALALAPLRG
jgi:hypothetical protein